MGAGVRDKAANIRARTERQCLSIPSVACSKYQRTSHHAPPPEDLAHLPLAETQTLLGACPSHSQSLGLYCWPLGDLEHPNYGKVYNLAKPTVLINP